MTCAPIFFHSRAASRYLAGGADAVHARRLHLLHDLRVLRPALVERRSKVGPKAVLERGDHAPDGNPRAARSAAVSRLARELDCLPGQATCLVLQTLGSDASHMLEAVEEVKISPPVQLKRVRPEDVRARRGVVSVDLAYRLGVLLDPVTAPVA